MLAITPIQNSYYRNNLKQNNNNLSNKVEYRNIDYLPNAYLPFWGKSTYDKAQKSLWYDTYIKYGNEKASEAGILRQLFDKDFEVGETVKVVDIGSGNGLLSKRVIHELNEVYPLNDIDYTAIDNSKDLLNIFKQNCKSNSDNVKIHAKFSDFFKDEQGENKYDYAIAAHSMYRKDILPAIYTVQKTLKPGGKAFIIKSHPNSLMNYFYDKYHIETDPKKLAKEHKSYKVPDVLPDILDNNSIEYRTYPVPYEVKIPDNLNDLKLLLSFIIDTPFDNLSKSKQFELLEDIDTFTYDGYLHCKNNIYEIGKNNQISFGSSKAINKLYNKFNKPIISLEHIEQWVNQFPPQDRKIAMKLADAVDYHSYSDVFEDVQKLHQKLCAKLKKDGFDTETFSDVDFTKAYTCKSGDIVSYLYRKANKIRNVCFKTMEGLISHNPDNIENRALIILDDYTGSGDQFLSEFYARNGANRELLNKYRKIYFAPLVANNSAVQKFNAVANGEYERIADMIIRECPKNHTDEGIRSALKEVSGKKLQMIEGRIEYPLLSKENKELSDNTKREMKKFLLKHNCGYPFGFGETQGHTAFFFTVPNNTPDLLWNSKLQEKGLIPLFQRTNDISIYPMCQNLSLKEQVW